MGVPGCCDASSDILRKKFATQLRAANAADRKAREEEEDEETVRGLLKGEVQAERHTEFKTVILTQIATFRCFYDSIVIRRSGNSVDNMGKAIIGLPPFNDIPLLLDLYDHEYDYLDELADDMMENSAAAAKFAIGRVSFPLISYFYGVLGQMFIGTSN